MRVALGAGRPRIVRQLLTESDAAVGRRRRGGRGVGVCADAGARRARPAEDSPRAGHRARRPRPRLHRADLGAHRHPVRRSCRRGRRRGRDLQSVLKEGGRDSRVGAGWLRARTGGQRDCRLGRPGRGGDSARAQLRAAAGRRCRLQLGACADVADIAAANATYPDARIDGAAYAESRATPPRVAWRGSGGRGHRVAAASTRGDWGIRIEGQPVDRSNALAADWQVVTPGYFEALGTPLRAGRTFTDADTDDVAPVIIVNETMARKYWPGHERDRHAGCRWADNDRWMTVVGVVADIHHRGLDVEPRPEMYRPHTQFRYGGQDAPAVPR